MLSLMSLSPEATAIVRIWKQYENDPGAIISSKQIAERATAEHAVELAPAEAETEIRALIDAGYIDGEELATMGSDRQYHNLLVCERGRRLLGVWPHADEFAALILDLDAQIASSGLAPAEKSRLTKLRDGLVRMLGDVASGYAAGQLPGF